MNLSAIAQSIFRPEQKDIYDIQTKAPGPKGRAAVYGRVPAGLPLR